MSGQGNIQGKTVKKEDEYMERSQGHVNKASKDAQEAEFQE